MYEQNGENVGCHTTVPIQCEGGISDTVGWKSNKHAISECLADSTLCSSRCCRSLLDLRPKRLDACLRTIKLCRFAPETKRREKGQIIFGQFDLHLQFALIQILLLLQKNCRYCSKNIHIFARVFLSKKC